MLGRLVQNALRDASHALGGKSHAERSRAWIQALAEQLRAHSQIAAPSETVISFCRSELGNRAEFRTNELLFDVLVATTRIVRAVNGKDLQALSKALWIVESELHRSDSREVLVDLNKLVLAEADNKVLVVSDSSTIVEWARCAVRELLDPAKSNVFLVTIPHPKDWCEPLMRQSHVFQLSAERCWLTAPSSGQPAAAAHVGR